MGSKGSEGERLKQTSEEQEREDEAASTQEPPAKDTYWESEVGRADLKLAQDIAKMPSFEEMKEDVEGLSTQEKKDYFEDKFHILERAARRGRYFKGSWLEHAKLAEDVEKMCFRQRDRVAREKRRPAEETPTSDEATTVGQEHATDAADDKGTPGDDRSTDDEPAAGEGEAPADLAEKSDIKKETGSDEGKEHTTAEASEDPTAGKETPDKNRPVTRIEDYDLYSEWVKLEMREKRILALDVVRRQSGGGDEPLMGEACKKAARLFLPHLSLGPEAMRKGTSKYLKDEYKKKGNLDNFSFMKLVELAMKDLELIQFVELADLMTGGDACETSENDD